MRLDNTCNSNSTERKRVHWGPKSGLPLRHLQHLRHLRHLHLLLFILPLRLLAACSEDAETTPAGTGGWEGMAGETADCEFSVLTLRSADGELSEVDINGLPVKEMQGAEKSGADTVAPVQRRGVRMSEVLAKAGITAVGDLTPVNCVARDGYDPLRTRLQSDVTQLPTFAFVRDEGYVYLGNPGDKDPLYPDMEGKSLTMDYDLAGDHEVPEELGGDLVAIRQFRWKMMEKVDEQHRGVLEIDPVVGAGQ